VAGQESTVAKESLEIEALIFSKYFVDLFVLECSLADFDRFEKINSL
jgi:hypothetical protein